MSDLAATSPPQGPELVLEAGRADAHYWRDLWRYRELFYFLTWRDLLVRYKQTAVGVAWALLQPLMMTTVFYVFGRVVQVPMPDGVPRFIFVFSGQLAWQFFSASLSASSNSLVGNAHLISKVYFPRLIVPASAVAVSFVDFLISAALMAVLMVAFSAAPGWSLLALPLFVALTFGAALGAGLWLTALNVKYRDFRFVLPFVVQIGLFVSPVAYATDTVPEKWRTFYALNPMVGVIDGFRWSLFGSSSPLAWTHVGLAAAVVALLLWSGTWYFRKMERTFADVI